MKKPIVELIAECQATGVKIVYRAGEVIVRGDTPLVQVALKKLRPRKKELIAHFAWDALLARQNQFWEACKAEADRTFERIKKTAAPRRCNAVGEVK